MKDNMTKDYANVHERTKGEMSTKQVTMDAPQRDGLSAAEREARKAVSRDPRTVCLVAWWDNTRKTGGPEEACKGEVRKCSQDYAKTRGASTKVDVNNGTFQFFYAPVPGGHAELNRDEALSIHRGLETMEQYDMHGG